MPEMSFDDLEQMLKSAGMKKPDNKGRVYDWDNVLEKIKETNIKERRPVIPSEVRKMAGTKHPNQTYQWLERHTISNINPGGELHCVKGDDGRKFYAHKDAIVELQKQQAEAEKAAKAKETELE